ncbi:murein hydrolase activator EnvC family protein [Novosphingobium album (ex Liu et al. 2023)]|uniref:Peptidoglycan DD-metalloendopeptidase family protein n=1 Tax=Novosphingobium album (ex Liu et al. 2023) TaxID=3031130 RepID=A0ABT5WP42_9SPHN|nr:peptidoglycan DD-metalloendopeptidase family protein [Novosphingobium album (ex Liu et al. 2023)]MDE8651816.1 peptidoglycan DD-metalloendopeptidase family protein [Novosphingobium album (ex Liu et al. 2023)]
MTSRRARCLVLLAALCGGAAAFGQGVTGGDVARTRSEMAEALREGAAARGRAERLEAEARAVTEQADRTAREAAAIAARIQETEAEIAGQEARARLLASERRKLRARLAERQRPLVQLTGALQRLSRRPPVLALLRPGSVRDTMYMRALLETMLPEVERRTASLRSEIERGRALENRALAAARDLKASERQLGQRRQELAAIETRQRLASRAVSGVASREAERALALAERASDLGDLVEEVGRQGELRAALASLPGPIMRPPRPEESRVVEASGLTASPTGLPAYMLPVTGRVVTGFGESGPGRAPSRGLSLAPRANAQAVAPAPGRVAFAGPYRGYGQIVIIEHDGGWTSLVTGLARLDVAVGQMLVAGSPLGVAGPGDPVIGVELRREGAPVNPLQYVRAL